MIDFRFTEICSFDPIEEEFECKQKIRSINPFRIVFFRKKQSVKISAYCDIEWQKLDFIEGPFTMRKGQVKSLTIKNSSGVLKASFRLLNDPSNEIYNHDWIINSINC